MCIRDRFQRWAFVENFEEEWKEELLRDDLHDDVISVDEHDGEEIIY